MHRLRAPVIAAVLIGALIVRTQIGTNTGAAEPAQHQAGAALPADELQPERMRPTTTTTTTTTTVPAPPPTTAAPAPPPVAVAPARVRPAAVPAPAPAAVAAPETETRALQLVNDERGRAGLPPLRLNGGATSVARAWSRAMAGGASLAHNPNLARDLERAGVTGWRSMGENVGEGSSADQMHALFMGSSGHRANILSSQFSEVGIGAVSGGGKLWLTMDFVGW